MYERPLHTCLELYEREGESSRGQEIDEDQRERERESSSLLFSRRSCCKLSQPVRSSVRFLTLSLQQVRSVVRAKERKAFTTFLDKNSVSSRKECLVPSPLAT